MRARLGWIAAVPAALSLVLLGGAAAAVPDNALQLNGTSQYVRFGTVGPTSDALNASQFTLELWFTRTGTGGATTSTGTGGVTAAPLIAKGRAEAENSTADMNYFLGVDAAGKLVADYEEGAGQASPGLNHPVTGATTITNNVWHHAAATLSFDAGAASWTWKLYLDGKLDATLNIAGANRGPRSDAIHRTTLGSALTTTGAAAGFFQGLVDEARIWNVPRTGAQIRASRNNEILSATTNMVGRWGLDEGSGTSAADTSASALPGTLVGTPLWVAGYTFPQDTTAPAAVQGLAGTPGNNSAALTWTANGESDLAGYNVFRATSTPVPTTGTALNGADLLQTTSFNDTGLTNGTQYHYAVVAVDTSNNNAPSTEVSVTPGAVGGALQLDSAQSEYVTFGSAPSLSAQMLTLETWFKRTGTGVGTSTGAGGLPDAVPLVTKGRAQAETPANLNMNYFLGFDETTGVLVADFEDTVNGGNHPVTGVTSVPTGPAWHHAAATYDGTTWRLYLDGKLDRLLAVGSFTPESTSIQHAAAGSAQDSTGVAAGFFAGELDETRVWNVARTGAQIRGSKNAELTGAATGLRGRWGYAETSGTTTADSSGNGNTGTLVNTPTRVAGYGFPQDAIPPTAPSGLDATAGDGSVSLTWTASGSADLAGYEVFRSTTSPVGTGGTPLNGGDLASSTSFTDDTAVNGTLYHYAVRAVDTANNASPLSNEDSATPAGGDPVFVGVGDIADCARTEDTATAALVASIPGHVWTVGDNVYPNGTAAEFANCYDPVWGQFNGRIRPAAGNHDYNTPNATGYYDYFNGAGNENGPAGDRDLGYYSYDITGNGANWHVVVLNSECETGTGLWLPGGCAAGSVQEQWLRNDLANASTNNIIAIWHKPRFGSSGNHGHMQALWQALYDYGADLALAGHWHNYERFSPLNATGGVDNTFGVRSFVIGTGGAGLSGFGTPQTGSELRESGTHGVLKFTLHASSYDWQFVPIAGQTFTDSGTQAVHGAPPAPSGGAFNFNGSSQYVTFGQATSSLGASALTLETWFRRTGAGVGTNTGTGGIASAVPLITKGRGEAEGSNVDMNYFLGIDATSGVLVADFEDSATGANHPASGSTAIAADGSWHHAAATYGGGAWRLYLDGKLERVVQVGAFTPRSDSIQHAALASALNSTGVAAGFFAGDLDEARIWNVARSGSQIRAAKDDEITGAATGLRGRWALNETSGTNVADTSGNGANGTAVANPGRVAGYGFPQDTTAPAAPTGLAATAGDGSVGLTWTPSSGSDVAGYDVFRSTSSPVGTGGTPLNGDDLVTAASFLDTTASNGTQYFYAVRAVDTADNRSGLSSEASATPVQGDPVFVGAGDIADCGRTQDTATAALVAGIPGQVFTLGDNVYPNGTDTEFANCYEPTWGAFKSRTRPAPGNHDYNTPGATGYYNYFNGVGVENGPAGDRDLGYYSYEISGNGVNWHVVVLNSDCEATGALWLNNGCAAGSVQEQWLRNDLANAPTNNIIAIWHKPRFSSGGGFSHMQAMWKALYDHGVDLALAGHWHNYERMAPANDLGAADSTFGVRSFVIGTAGAATTGFGTPIGISEVRNGGTFGVMKFTLHASSYDWQFVPISGQTFTDSGTQAVHGPPDTTAPVVDVVSAVPASIGAGDPSTVVTWNASENGTFSVRVGGTSCTTGTPVDSGSYTTAPANRTTTVNASALAEGANTIRVCVTDGAINTGSDTIAVTKDTTGPTVDVVSAVPAALGASDTSTTITWNASENGSFSVRVGGTSCATGSVVDSGSYSTAPANRTSNVSASALAEGANTIRVCVTDGAGNSGNDTINVTKDTTAPTVDAVSAVPAAVGAGDTSTTITWNATENGSFSVRVGGTSCATGTQVASGNYTTAPANTTSSVPTSALSDGPNTIRVCVTDAAGNTGADTIEVSKDSTAPTVDVVSAVPASLGAGDLATTITWNASENGTFSVRVGGTSCATGSEVDSGTYVTSPANRTSNVSASALAEGANTIRVCVTDGASNSGNDTISVTKDTTGPTVDVVSAVPAALGASDSSTTITWNASENSSYSVRVGGTDCATGTQVDSGSYTTAPANTTATVAASALAEGANTVRVCVTDAAGNAGSDTIAVTKDTAGPVVDVVSAVPAALGAGDTSTTITWNATENGSFSVRVGGSSCATGTQVASGNYTTAPANTTSSVAASALADGPNTIRVCVTDGAGNSGSDTIEVSKDTTAPTVDVVSAVPASLGAGDPSTVVTWNASENGSFSVRVGGTSCTTGTPVDSGSYTTAPANRTTTVNASALAEGANTIRVCVTDAAGNSGNDTTTVTKDTTGPTVDVVSAVPAALGAGDTSTTITWNASENGSFSVRVGGSDCATGSVVDSGSYSTAPANRTSNVSASALAEGANTIRVCVADAAGNSGSDTISVTKDTAGPVVDIVSAVPAALGAGDASTTITWNADQNGTYSVRVGGTSCSTGTQVTSGNYTTAPANTTSSVAASALAEGANTIRVCVLDAASNTGADLVTVTKDTTAPTVDVVSAVPAALGAGDLGTTVTWNANDNGTFSVRVGGTSCTTGSVVESGTYVTSPSNRTSSVSASALAEGSNTIRVCVTDAAGNTGSDTIVVTKDTAGPVVDVVSAVPAALGAGHASTLVTWNANENGSYSVRVGGTDCTTGSQVGSGSYTTAPANTTATVAASALAEGANTIRVCVTDAGGSTGSDTIVVTKDTTAPATPSITSSSPSSPAEDNNPELIGTAEAGSTVRLYTTADCSGTVAASDSAAVFGSSGLTVTVIENSSTTFYARATDGAGNVSGCSTGFTYVEAAGPPAADPLLLSFLADGTAGSLAFADEDIVSFDGSSFSLVFDGSDVGVGALNLDAFSFLDEDSILLSFATAATIGSLGTVDDSDVVRFDASALGPATAGSFSLYFDGSDVSLSSDGEDVDAIQRLADGRLLLSTTDTPSISGVSSPRDEDLLAFTPTSLGATTAGTYAMHFEGSDVGLSTDSGEDVDAAWTSATGEIFLSTFGPFAVTGGLSGADEDVFLCNPTSLGTTTACSFSPTLVFDGSAHGLAANNVDGVGRVHGPVSDGEAPTPPTNLVATAVGANRIDLSWTASTDNVGVTQYRIFRNGTDIGPTQSTTFSNTGLQPGTTYSYVVRAYDLAGNASAPSDPAGATTGPADEVLTFNVDADTFIEEASPTATHGGETAVGVDGSPVKHMLMRFVAAGINGRQVTSARLRLHCVDSSSSGGTFFRAASTPWAENTVNWNSAPAVTGNALSSLGSVSSSTWYETSVAGAVTGDGTYSFRVTSTNSNGADYASKERGGGLGAQLILTVAGTPPEPDTEAPTTPENLDAVAISPNRVDLTWTASTDNRGVQGYKIYRDGIQIATTTGTGTTFSDTGVLPNTPYTYNVAAYDTQNTSLQSAPDSVTTPPAPPAPTTLTFAPTEDAYVRDDQATSNFGTATTLQVDGSPQKKFLLKFAVTGVGARAVVSAKLRLHAVDSSPNGGEVHGAATNSWSESTITWNTPFAHDPAALASFGPVSSGNWYELELKTYYNGDGTKTIVVTTPAADGADFVSKEGTAALRPQLVLTVQ